MSATRTLDRAAKIIVLVRDNPFREGTAVHGRVGAVLRANGRTVETALRGGARTSTVRHLVGEKMVRLETPKKAATK